MGPGSVAKSAMIILVVGAAREPPTMYTLGDNIDFNTINAGAVGDHADRPYVAAYHCGHWGADGMRNAGNAHAVGDS